MRGEAKWRVLGLVAVGTFMTTLDSSIVNISLPAIARGFDTPLSGEIEWVVSVYLVAIAALLLTFGRLSDIVGRKSITLVGLVVFTLGSALCGLAPSLGVLIAARAFQGVGGALIFAPSVALLTDAFPPQERGRAIGLNAVGVAAGVSAGPALGGLITAHLSCVAAGAGRARDWPVPVAQQSGAHGGGARKMSRARRRACSAPGAWSARA